MRHEMTERRKMMLKRFLGKLNKETAIKFTSLFLVAVITVSTIVLVIINNRKSAAYLYDESNVSVKYGVAKLSFDLSSNHMVSYYAQDDSYTPEFISMLDTLKTLVSGFDSEAHHNLETFEIAVKAAMTLTENDTTGYYSQAFITALSNVWNQYRSGENGYSIDDYYDDTYNIYNTYYHDYKNLFRIKNMAVDSIENDSTVWYYYAKDLVETYYGKDGSYVVQTDATGLRQSTVKIDVKLKGGTTFNNNTDLTQNPYYDALFNEMVSPLTLNFCNTGDVSLYLNYLINMKSQENAGNGVLGMVLPYGSDFETLKSDATYSPYFNATTGKWDFRGLICALFTHYTFTYPTPIADYSKLDYLTMETLLQEWNLYAVQTYSTNFADHSLLSLRNNLIINPTSSNLTDYLKTINASMLFWADYEKVDGNYDAATPESWRVDDEYGRYNYSFTVKLLTSLKDDDMSKFTEDDWSQIYNNMVEYNKAAGVSNFDVDGDAFFENDDGNDTSIQYMEGGYIICNYTDPTARNYIGKLRFSVKYRGFSPANIRVRLVEQFTNTSGKIVAINLIKFKCAQNWYDNRANDLYFYSDKLFSSIDTGTLTRDGRPKYLNIPVITGIEFPQGHENSMAAIDEILGEDTTMKMKVSIYVEAVQPNRTEEYWGVDINQIVNDIRNP